MLVLLLNLTGTTASTCYAAGSIVETPKGIHERAWRQAAESALTGSEFQKYAIYSSRSLAVANPEVYLQADEAWMKMMYDFSGWGANYLARDRKLTRETGWYEEVESKIAEGLHIIEPEKAQEPFNWTLFRWADHRRNAIDLFDLYEGAPVFSVLDNRLMFIWSAMKGTKWRMPYTSLAEAAILSDLAEGTRLVNRSDFAMATMVAMRIVNQYTWRVRPLADISGRLFTARYAESDQYGDSPYEQQCIGMVVTEIGNRLCPITSVWASDVQANASDPRKALERLGSAYHERFHRTDHDSKWVYGDYYHCWLPNLDDKLLSHLGNCLVEAGNTMAVLTLADVDDWEVFETNWLTIGEGGGHVICGAYTPKGNCTLNNGLFNPTDRACRRGPLWDINGRVAFAMIYAPEAGFITTVQTYNPKRFSAFETPYTNMSFDETVAFLERIADLERHVSFMVDRPTYKSLPEYIEYMTLNRDKWEKNMTKWSW
jgi:hypothetical protein